MINPIHDAEMVRQQKNLTNTQKRSNAQTREGVLVNSLICPQCDSFNLNDTMDAMVISEKSRMPEKLYERETKKEKSLFPIAGVAVGVMGAITGISALIRHSSKINLNIDSLKRLSGTIRNVALNDEIDQAWYRIVECPNYKTIQAGVGVFAMTAMAFMGKTFFDGFKDVWVKKREADIQKNLQENLVAVETQSFSGKMQIIRSMLSQKAIELNKYLNIEPSSTNSFKALMFKGSNSKKPEKKEGYILTGLVTFASIVGLGFLSLRNLTKSKGHIEKFVKDTYKEINTIVKNSTASSKKSDMANLENMFKTVEANEEDMRKILKPLDWADKEEFISKISKYNKKSTVEANANCGGGETPKPTFYSHVNDYRAFLYNYLLDTDNKQFRALFLGITGLTAIGYGGKLAGDAIKEVQVKKINAETELELQKRLVSTELRNFKAKKDSAIQPLVEEFYRQVDAGKSKAELKTMAENILFEIKNGAPFVYS